MFSKLTSYIIRKRNPVIINNLNIFRPVSKIFGFERGTPIDRYYIEKFLKINSKYITGNVLEIGDDYYGKRFGGETIESLEILTKEENNQANKYVGDLTELSTLPEKRFDSFICPQTFNFIFDVQKAIIGAHHLLKPGGILIATVAGLTQISRYDMKKWGDYWRFTTASVEKLFSPVFQGGLKIECYGNVLAAASLLYGIAVEDLPDRSMLDQKDEDYQIVICFIARKANR